MPGPPVPVPAAIALAALGVAEPTFRWDVAEPTFRWAGPQAGTPSSSSRAVLNSLRCFTPRKVCFSSLVMKI